MRVAVVDIGTNSTRLLIADVNPSSGTLEELVRHSRVTRLGDGVDANGSLPPLSLLSPEDVPVLAIDRTTRKAVARRLSR